ncbi:MAG: hypothetical protein OQJ97_06970 [Rhodospirillales bacterium]|nr:hypothetical protein [Rhodospirillales bacterium]
MRQTTIILVLLAVALTFTLFKVKYGVQHLEEELSSLNRAIHAHQESIHVLQAEWSHLNEPERLRKLAAKHLDLTPLGSSQIGSISDFPVSVGNETPVDQEADASGRQPGTHLTSGKAH